MSQHIYTLRRTCRACCGDDLREVLDLGVQPLANAFLKAEDLDKPELRVPLKLNVCRRCGLGQLSHVVDPDVLYGPAYPYRSGYSEGWYWHCEELAAEVCFPGAKTLDIGCLDGVLMKSMRARGCWPFGVDPSAPEGSGEAIAPIMFDHSTRLDLPFDIITAQNVFGHVDDARGFLEGIAANLAPDGTAIIECPWIVDMVEKGAWDTIYHEHLSYWSLRSLARVAGAANLAVARVKHFPALHGGTMRYYLGHKQAVHTFDSSMCAAWLAEEDLDEQRWTLFENQWQTDRAVWTEFFDRDDCIWAWGASAKLNTFLNALPARPKICGIIDESPAKHGLFSPGWHFPVVLPEHAAFQEGSQLLIGAGNWADQIEYRARKLGYKGEVVALWRQ